MPRPSRRPAFSFPGAMLGALLSLMLAAGGGIVALAAPAQAAACAGASGVTVVVDFGGRQVTKCATGDPASAQEALASLFNVRTAPNGIICQINYKPADASKCHANPNYWSFYHRAGTSGTWQYSTVGAGSYDPKPGSSVGFAFGPRATPPNGAASNGTTTSSTQKPAAQSGGSSGGTGGSGSSGSGGSGGSGGQAAQPSNPKVATPTVAPSKAATGSKAKKKSAQKKQNKKKRNKKAKKKRQQRGTFLGPSTAIAPTAYLGREVNGRGTGETDGGGLPAWAWALIALGVLAGAGATAAVARRNHPDDEE